MSADIQLTASIDFSGAERQVNDFATKASRKLSDIVAKATAPGGSQTRPGGGSNGAGRSPIDQAKQELANLRALEAAKNRALGIELRIQRQLQGNAELSARTTSALDAYSRALGTHGTRTLEGVRAQSAFRMEMTRLNSAIAQQGGLLVTLNRGFNGTVAAIQALGSSLSGMGGAMGVALTGLANLSVRASSAAEGTTAIGGAMRALTSTTALTVAGMAAVAAVTWTVAKATTEAHDKVSMLQQRFTVLSGSTEGGQAALAALVKSANQMGVGLEDGAQAMSRLLLAGKEIGLTAKDAGVMADTFMKLGRIAGATTQELSSGMVQFGQALASGKLQGDEFRSLMETSPLLMRAIAKELGVSTGAMKALSSEGRITADVMTGALLSAAQDVDKQFQHLPRTASAMATEIGNNWTLLLSDLDNLFAGSALVKSVYGFFNDAINKARGLINPSDDERAAQLRDTIAKRQKAIDDRNGPGWLNWKSPFNDGQDAQAIAKAQAELDDILKRQQERAQKEREDDLQAALQRELATRTRHQQVVDKLTLDADPIAKAAKERDDSIRTLNDALKDGAISESRYRNVLASVNSQYDEAVRRANKRENTLDKARDKMAARIAEIGHEAESTMRLAEATLKGGDAYAEMSRQIDTETKLRELNRQAKEAGITLDEREAKAKLEAASAAQRYNEAASFARNLVDEYATPQEKAARRLDELKRNYDELLRSGNAIPQEVTTAFERAKADALIAGDSIAQAFKSLADDIHENLKTSYGDFSEDDPNIAKFKQAFIEAFH